MTTYAPTLKTPVKTKPGVKTFSDLKTNAQSCHEHRARLEKENRRPLSPEEEQKLFPNEPQAWRTQEQYLEVERRWHIKANAIAEANARTKRPPSNTRPDYTIKPFKERCTNVGGAPDPLEELRKQADALHINKE